MRAVGGLLVVVVLASCTGLTVDPADRPCNDEEPCGPGTVCDPKTNTCVAEVQVDGSTVDAAVDQPVQDLAASEAGADLADAADGPAPGDGPAPDILQPDLYLVPDAGCPVGYTICGTACVDITSDIDHCGGCSSPCPAGAADQCVAGKCVCGSTGDVCPAGLDCVGGVCACVIGGRCDGCCNGPACVPLGSGQSVTLCGQNGETCQDCHDGNYCTEETCSAAGACVSTNRPDGTGCSDGNDCSHSDACQSGVCVGVTYSCDDSLSCTNDSCTGNPPPNECTHTLSSYRCLIAGVCYYNGEGNPTAPCAEVCDVSQNQAAWTAYTGPCVMTVAGDGASTYKDGPALSASFNQPFGVLAAGGKVYVAERSNHRVRLVDAAVVSTVAGTGASGFADGSALTVAQFDEPHGLALEASGGILVADQDNHRIRRIAGGSVTTAAGTGTQGLVDGAALSAGFNYPTGIAIGSAGVVYIADRSNHCIRAIATDGQVSTFAGDGTSGLQDGAAAQARFSSPQGVAVDGSGNVYVADTYNHRIRMISGGQVSTIAGSGTTAGFQDGAAATSRLSSPLGVAVDSAGTVVYFSDANQRIRTISAGTVDTLAGSGSTGYRDGVAAQARFDGPAGLALDGTDVYVADRYNHRIRVIKP